MNLEWQLKELRTYVHKNQKNILEAYLSKKILLTHVFEDLTTLAEQALEKASAIALEETRNKFPSPQGSFTIVGMGKLGGREMTFYSDLDLLFLYEKADDIECYTYFVRRVISALTLVTLEGYAYHIDTELRPSGNAGMLLSTLDGFEFYHLHAAQHWERQALLKARPLLILSQMKPSPEFYYRTQNVIDHIRYQEFKTDKKALSRELYEIRLRIQNEISKETKNLYNIKSGYGGLIDIEFLAQYFQMTEAHRYPLLQTTSTLQALQALASLDLFPYQDIQHLLSLYMYYREMETYFRITLEKSTDQIRFPSEVTTQVEDTYYQGKNILVNYLPNRQIVRSLYIKALGLEEA